LPKLFLTERARQDLASLPRLVQEAIVGTLTLIEADPEVEGKPLRGRLRGLWSSRTGNYRVLYTIEGKGHKLRVIIRAIKHRGEAYRRGRRHTRS
jgi:mRNA-degrading endonuclease RelE of RelBE toxin-antitoxin system